MDLGPVSGRRLSRTPIERAIDLDKGDRRLRWELNQRQAGFKRVQLRVHETDEDRLRAYAARLLRRWETCR